MPCLKPPKVRTHILITYLEHICVAVMGIFNYYCLGPRQSVGYAVLVLITYCLWKNAKYY